jgi:hypothetical protein
MTLRSPDTRSMSKCSIIVTELYVAIGMPTSKTPVHFYSNLLSVEREIAYTDHQQLLQYVLGILSSGKG